MEPIGVLGEAQKKSPEESVSGEQPDGRRTQLTQGLQEDVVEDTDALGTGASQRWPQVGQGLFGRKRLPSWRAEPLRLKHEG